MNAIRELTFFFAVFIGAVMADQEQYDDYQYQFSAKEQLAFNEIFEQEIKEQDDNE